MNNRANVPGAAARDPDPAAVPAVAGYLPGAAHVAGGGVAHQHLWRHPRPVRGPDTALRPVWVPAQRQLPLPRGLRRQVRERNVLFNDALNTFYLRLYGVRHMVKDHSDSATGESQLAGFTDQGFKYEECWTLCFLSNAFGYFWLLNKAV